MYRQSHSNGNDKVEDNRENKGQHQNKRLIQRSSLADGNEMAPLAHVVGDHEQNGCDDGHGDHFCQRHEHNEEQRQHDGVDDACNGGAAAVFDVGGGARNGTRGGNAAEQSRAYVANTLGDQLGVRVVAIIDHAVGNHAREQRLDGGENGNGKGAGKHGLDGRKFKRGQRGGGEGRGEVGIERANGVDACLERREFDQQNAHDDGNDGGRDLAEYDGELAQLFHLAKHGPDDENDHADAANEQGGGVEGRDRMNDGLELFHGLNGMRACGKGKSKEVLDLTDDDGDGNACREADGDGGGNVLDERAEMKDTHQNEQDTCHERGQHQTRQPVGGNDARHDGRKGGRGPRDIDAATAEQGDRKAGDDGGVQSLLGRDTRRNGERDGEGQGNDGDDNAGDNVGGKLLAAVRS